MRGESLKEIGQFAAAGLLEEPERSLFYRKALALRRFYENCELPPYNGELLYPSGVFSAPFYMDNLPIDLKKIETFDKGIADELADTFYRYSSSVPDEHTVGGNMWIHSIPNYERILHEGFASYVPRIKKIQDIYMRDGLLHLLSGIEALVARMVDYLEIVDFGIYG